MTHIQEVHFHPWTAYSLVSPSFHPPPPSDHAACATLAALAYLYIIFSSFPPKLLCVLCLCTCTPWCPAVFSLCMQISTATRSWTQPNVLYPNSVRTHYPCLPFVNTLKSWLSAIRFMLENKQHYFINMHHAALFMFHCLARFHPDPILEISVRGFQGYLKFISITQLKKQILDQGHFLLNNTS